ncbi:hypothetical protein J2T04_003580 [Chryseobacterium lathyri]|uniref:Uncharacterized protein n=1 Tax=Chryseobacterium lathyri TaxID=395933 RepID=A0ABT9SQF2_9FLAO|nr:hypothetical protein [Chryseobacterium lathyri]
MVLYLHVIVNMKYKDKKVLEWTIIDGVKYPKKVVYLVDKLPNRDKGNGKMIDTVFQNKANVRLDRKR